MLDATTFKEKSRFKLTNPTAATAGLGITMRPKNVALTEKGKRIIFSDLANNTLSAVDAETGNVLQSVKVGKAPYGIALLPRR